MTFDEYQRTALSTDSFGPDAHSASITNPAYVAKVLGLVGEAGEVAEKFKKLIRDQREPTEEERKELLKELGDVLWYVAVVAKYLGSDLDNVAAVNLKKLADRQGRGVIKGTGDNR